MAKIGQKRSSKGSKRMTSRFRHKVDRKNRERRRDIRKAAKIMKGQGMKVRTKKVREASKAALRISNASPDKEKILEKILEAREVRRVERANRRLQRKEDTRAAEGSDDGEAVATPQDHQEQQRQKQSADMKKFLLVQPRHGSNFRYQFNLVLDDLFCEVPSYIVAVDARCAVQSIPWTLIDAVVSRQEEVLDEADNNDGNDKEEGGSAKKKKRARAGEQEEGDKKKQNAIQPKLVLIAMTKIDRLPPSAIANQHEEVAEAIFRRYKDSKVFQDKHVEFVCVPFHHQFEKTVKHFMRVLRTFQEMLEESGTQSGNTTSTTTSNSSDNNSNNNLKGKLCSCLLGFPNTGKSTLLRTLRAQYGDSNIAAMPFRTIMKVQRRKAKGEDSKKSEEEEEDTDTKLVVPGAKSFTFFTMPDDNDVTRASIVSGDVVFHSFSRIEKIPDPESAAIMLVSNVKDQIALAQNFTMPVSETPQNFLVSLGRRILKEGGFYPSAFSSTNVTTAGKLSSSNISAVTDHFIAGRIVKVHPKKGDGRNPLKIGSRIFLKEFFDSKHMPWVCYPSTPASSSADKRLMSAKVFTQRLMEGKTKVAANKQQKNGTTTEDETADSKKSNILQMLLGGVTVLLPKGVIEVDEKALAPQQFALDEEEEVEEEEEDVEEEEEEEEEEEGEEEEEEEGEADE